MNERPQCDETPEQDDVVLGQSGGIPAVAAGTPLEQTEQGPMVVRDSASADVPAVAVSEDETTSGEGDGDAEAQ